MTSGRSGRGSSTWSATTTRRTPRRAPVYEAGQGAVRYAGRNYDADEMVNLVDASLDFWLTAGRYSDRFEAGLASYLGVEAALLVNSGSSANLVAFSSLTSPKLKDRRVRPGRRSHHGGRGVSDDGEPDPAEPGRSGVRRCRTRHLRADARIDRARHRPANQGGDDRPHDGRAVRREGTARAVRPARPVADRGQLRRAGLQVRRAADRHVRPPRVDQLLSCAPHHDGRRRRRG